MAIRKKKLLSIFVLPTSFSLKKSLTAKNTCFVTLWKNKCVTTHTHIRSHTCSQYSHTDRRSHSLSHIHKHTHSLTYSLTDKHWHTNAQTLSLTHWKILTITLTNWQTPTQTDIQTSNISAQQKSKKQELILPTKWWDVPKRKSIWIFSILQ